MSEQLGYSPSFKRPADVLRMRRRRGSKPAHSAASAATARPSSPGLPLENQTRSGGGVKRRNPFGLQSPSSSPKRRLGIHRDGATESFGEEAASSVPGLDQPPATVRPGLDQPPATVRPGLDQPPATKGLTFSDEESLFEQEKQPKPFLLKSPEVVAPPFVMPPPMHEEYPADWSIKTRLLITSSLPFSWAEQPKAQEEALGLHQHCRAHYTTIPADIQEPRCCAELRCSFQQSLLYWQHPSLSWLSLFPRMHSERSFSGKSTPWAHDQALQQSLMRDWAVGFGGKGCISALLSPTTRGLREAMRAEGIEFSLPLVEEGRKSRGEPTSARPQTEEEEEQEEERSELRGGGDCEDEGCDEDEDDDGGFSWLKEMGVQDQIKKPDGIFLQLRKECQSVSLDHKPESVVSVEGSHTFTLLNFLINWKSLVASAGSQAGLPPTLLAPGPFRGATLHSLKARSINVKTQVRSSYQDVCSLEVSGPVLPSTLHAITRLLRTSQRGAFSMTLYTPPPTAVLNTHPPTQQSVCLSADVPSCGLHPSTVKHLQTASPLGKTSLRHLAMTSDLFTWDS